jgi:trans-aconitate 2-methyltransferase
VSGWNPDAYLKFEDERTRPSIDLAGRIRLEDPASIVDLGCGPGNSTRILRERWPRARIVGLDNSPEMIEKARSDRPGGEWTLADAGTWSPDVRFDLVFSNATLQWIPGHETLIPRLFDRAAGALAVQVPANGGSPLHQALLAAARSPRWRSATAGCADLITYRDAEFYYDVLSGLSARIELWRTEYLHVLEGRRGLVEWYASTGMRPYLERLGVETERAAFTEAVLKGCEDAYPLRPDGRVLFPFRRLFFIAYRNGGRA